MLDETNRQAASPASVICRETVYAHLRRAAGNVLRGERRGHLLQPTALLHEALIRLDGRCSDMPRTAFVVAAVGEMRRALIDHLRAESAQKRGGGRARIELDTAALVLNEPTTAFHDLHGALQRLAELSPRQARVVELRYFGGLSEEETAEALGVSRRTVQTDWRGARAWLRRELSNTSVSPPPLERESALVPDSAGIPSGAPNPRQPPKTQNRPRSIHAPLRLSDVRGAEP